MPDRETRSEVVPTAQRDPWWMRAPVALAMLDGEDVVAWNPVCRALLRRAVGGSELAWRRWLAAAAIRKAIDADGRDGPASAPDRETDLEVVFGESAAPGGPRLVALREVGPSPRRDGGLVETVSTLSHELRTPLASIKNSLKLVLDGEAGSLTADQERFLGMTTRNISRLERLVNDLLDVSQAEVGHLALHRRDTDLGPMMREAVAQLAADARDRGLELDIGGLPRRFVAHVDADKIVQMVNNVVGNAIKYVPSGGMVRVWLEPGPLPAPGLARALACQLLLPLQTFNIVVEDNGPGIEPKHLARVFEPFLRGMAHAAEGIGGAGLGLHITRRLVEAHGGVMRLASSQGGGTTVWIRLPRDAASGQLMTAAIMLDAARTAAADGDEGGRVVYLDARPWPAQAAAILEAARRFLDSAAVRVVGSGVEPGDGILAAVVMGGGFDEAWADQVASSSRESAGGFPVGALWQELDLSGRPVGERAPAP